ncbi:MAG: hypothetical protein JWN78_2687 [Bacteroidota bacterium]|nr:hypothetical protein [Bacteroidota bacterium]
MSDLFKEYKIPHAGLKREIHEFSYELDETFFANFDNALITKCNIQVNITFDKRHEPYIIEVDMDGTIWGECDRCTSSIPLSIHTSFIIYVKYTYDEALKDMEDVEIIYIAKDDTVIDITQFLYDYAHLSIPVHKICDKPGETEYCDEEIIKLLEQKIEDNTVDPRWAGLDKLKDKLK